MKRASRLIVFLFAIAISGACAINAAAQSDAPGTSSPFSGTPALSVTQASKPASSSPVENFIDNWLAMVTRIQSEQPVFITPIVTVTPRLEQEFRYDQFWQGNQHGIATDNFGGGKGIELIPYQNIEVILGIPAWIAHNGTPQQAHGDKKPDTDGWADETFLIKYRIVSADAEHGNYIVTAFMGFSAPTGDDGNSSRHGIFTPTIAMAKGFGDFDVQTTAGISLPDGGLQRLGMPLAWNTAFQYRIERYFWPEFEVNYTWWPNGEREGQTQVFLTPGLVIGRIPIHDRIGITAGLGYQVAVTDKPAYNHSVILTGRIPF